MQNCIYLTCVYMCMLSIHCFPQSKLYASLHVWLIFDMIWPIKLHSRGKIHTYRLCNTFKWYTLCTMEYISRPSHLYIFLNMHRSLKVRVQTKKIQVTSRIFHGISQERVAFNYFIPCYVIPLNTQSWLSCIISD